jgi:hypothetical protein
MQRKRKGFVLKIPLVASTSSSSSRYPSPSDVKKTSNHGRSQIGPRTGTHLRGQRRRGRATHHHDNIMRVRSLVPTVVTTRLLPGGSSRTRRAATGIDPDLCCCRFFFVYGGSHAHTMFSARS